MQLPGLEVERKLAGEAGERIDDFAGKGRRGREDDGEEECAEEVQRGRRRQRLRGSCHSLLLEMSPLPLLTAHEVVPSLPVLILSCVYILLSVGGHTEVWIFFFFCLLIIDTVELINESIN